MIKFRLYPENGSIYFTVYILPDLRQMQEFLINVWAVEEQKAKRTSAWMLLVSRGKQYGILVFNLTGLTESSVAHELQHAVLAFAERKKILKNPLFYLRSPEAGYRLEERLAEVAGELHRQFRWKCKKRKIGIK